MVSEAFKTLPGMSAEVDQPVGAPVRRLRCGASDQRGLNRIYSCVKKYELLGKLCRTLTFPWQTDCFADKAMLFQRFPRPAINGHVFGVSRCKVGVDDMDLEVEKKNSPELQGTNGAG